MIKACDQSIGRHSATYISTYSSIYSAGQVLELCMSKIPQPRTWSNGDLPSLFVSLSLSVFFSFCLWLSLTRRSCLALSLARAFLLLLEGSSTFVPSRTPLTPQPAGTVSCRHPLSSSLLISGSSSLFSHFFRLYLLRARSHMR